MAINGWRKVDSSRNRVQWRKIVKVPTKAFIMYKDLSGEVVRGSRMKHLKGLVSVVKYKRRIGSLPKGRYKTVILLSDEDGHIEYQDVQEFTTKSQALKYAKQYMKTH